MKKTVSVNLGGRVFVLDEDAYASLNNYIESIASVFDGQEGKDEIIGDIELRIGELLSALMDGKRTVATAEDVEEIIRIMGQPEDFADDAFENQHPPKTKIKRLFRDPDDKILGGVCSGIGHYLGIDPVWLRFAFVIALVFFGTGVLFYLILWLVIPEAKTTADKLMMRGKPVNVANIGKFFQQELSNIGDRLGKTEAFSGINKTRATTFLNNLFVALGSFLKIVARIILVMLGAFLVLTGIVGLLSFGGIFIGLSPLILGFETFLVPGIDIMDAGEVFITNGLLFIFTVLALGLVLALPFLAFLYLGTRIIFRKFRIPYLMLSLSLLWIAGVAMLLSSLLFLAIDFVDEERLTENYDLPISASKNDTLYIGTLDSDTFYGWEDCLPNCASFYVSDGDVIAMADVELSARPALQSRPKLQVVRVGRGHNEKTARARASGITFSFEIDSNRVFIDRFFKVDKNDGWRAQSLEYIFYLPVGTVLWLSNTSEALLSENYKLHNALPPGVDGHYWRMTRQGLECIDCK
ncbi:MAG: PspC domain-containing protein [Salibacteraceae bacterium]